MSRIEELERRVRQDPASITFGALAEEYRRAGRLDDAVAACRAGLERHPSYVSARVTLGRALQQLGQSSDARAEFEHVLTLAPDNLAAIRGLAEMHGIDAHDTPYQTFTPPPAEPAPAPMIVPEPELVIVREPEPVIALEPEPQREIISSFGPGDPDFAALDASIAAASITAGAADIADLADSPDVTESVRPADTDGAHEAKRAAQIERLEIWLARLDELRRTGARHA